MLIGRNLFLFFLVSIFLGLGFSASAQQVQPASTVGAPKSTKVQTFNTKDSAAAAAAAAGLPQKTPTAIPSQLLEPGTAYTVHVLGEVQFPGVYKVLPSDRVTTVLTYAGGILPSGTERFIKLTRGSSASYLDLFQYKYSANLSQNPFVNDNDVLFVGVKKSQVEIQGPVNRPGTYEIGKSTHLKALIDLAGGVSSGMSKIEPIRILRYEGNEQKEIIEVAYDVKEISKVKIISGDVVIMPHVLLSDKKFDYDLKRIPGDNMFYPTDDENVYVMGSVAQPGAFMYEPNYSYREYIGLAGVNDSSNIRSVKLIRKDGKRVRVTADTMIAAGDTIFVPRKYWRPETVTSLISTLASLTLTSVIIEDRISK